MKQIRFYQIITAISCLFLISCGIEQNLKKADKHLSLGEYYDAATQYKKVYTKTPTKERAARGKVALKMARCYDKINSTPKALAAYSNAIRYKQADLNDRLAYARLLLKNGSYRQAAKEFEFLLDSMPDNVLVKNGLESAQKAPVWKKEGSRYKVKRMDVFNSRRDDYSPMFLSDDNSQLYFTSTRNEAQGSDLNGVTGTKSADIFFSEKNDKGKWSKPEAIGTGLNTDYEEGACCFTPDGKQMYLTQCATDPTSPRLAQIVTSNRSDAAWSKPTNLEISKDTLSCFAHPAISPDGEWLYFVSDMPGGKGGLDIYIAKVNSITRKYELTHPGYPLNTEADDFGMTFEGLHNQGFFCSNRKDGRGYDHIYSFENPEIVTTMKGWVYEKDGYELPAAEVRIVGNDGTNRKLSVKGDGSFVLPINPHVDYLVMASCKGYLNHKEELRVDSAKESKEYVLQFPLASITAPVLIDNIFYDFDKATLTEASTTALDQLVTLLKENPHVTIELSAHCDYKGNSEYNKHLSLRRAQSVVDYLIKHGIEKERLTPVGYGKEKPKNVRKKLTEKYPWLKEGDVLNEEFILKQSKEHQEICNQLNRRTEFKVLRTTYKLF